MKPNVDYSIYLVTDSTEAILGQRDLVEVVEKALEGGKSAISPLNIGNRMFAPSSLLALT
jgi:thiamine monophosphate synthase